MKQSVFATLILGAGVLANSAIAQDRPLALVEHVTTSEAGVQPFDYVYENDKIDLRPGGELRLAYFDRCVVETFTGGVVKLKQDKAKISKGGESHTETRPCQTAGLALSDSAREAGVAVKRVSPFDTEEWREISIASATPSFVWPKNEKAKTAATIRVYLLEADPPELIWEGNAQANVITYPEDAPLLQTGMPYQVIVSYSEKKKQSVVFSIDPGLELPDSPLTTAVPLGL